MSAYRPLPARFTAAAALAPLLLLLSACDGGTGPRPEVATIGLVVDMAAATAGQPLPVDVVVKDADERGLADVEVTLEMLEAGGQLSATRVTTGSTGSAQVVWTLAPATGSQNLRAHAGGQSFTLGVAARPPAGELANLEFVSGAQQEAPAGSELEQPLVVRAVDSSGQPVPGIALGWTVQTGGGTITPDRAETGTDGRVTARWRLGAAAGEQRVQIRAARGGTEITLSVPATAFTGLRIRTELPAPRAARPYHAPLAAWGGAGAYTWTLAGGALPPGVALAPAGALSGTPTAEGSYTFTLRASDGAGTSGERAYTLRVCGGPLALAVGATAVVEFPDPCGAYLPGTAGHAYRVGLMARGELRGPRPVPGGLLLRSTFEAPGAAPGMSPGAAPRLALRSRGLGAPPVSARDAEHVRMLEADRRRFAGYRAPALGPARPRMQVSPPASTRTFLVRSPQGAVVEVKATLRLTSPSVAYYQDDGVAADGGTVYTDERIRGELDFYEAYGRPVIDNVYGGLGPTGTTRAFTDGAGTVLELPAADLDRNGRVVALQLRSSLITPNGYVTVCDRLPRPGHAATPGGQTCDTSNEGEIVYVRGPGRYLLIHEVKHVSSHGWAAFGGRGFHEGWIEEGTAVVASEKASRAAAGMAPTRRVGAADIYVSGGQESPVTQNMWAAVLTGAFYVAAAPLSSLVGDPNPNPGGSSYYGASWLFHRWLEDAYGTGDGVAPLRAQNLERAGRAGVEALTGKTMGALLAEFMAALAVDGVPAARAAAPRTFRGYDFAGILAAEPREENRLGAWPFVEARSAFASAEWSLAGMYFTAPLFFDFEAGGGGFLRLDALDAAGGALPAPHAVALTVTRIR